MFGARGGARQTDVGARLSGLVHLNSIQHAKARVQKAFLTDVKVGTHDLRGQPADETLTSVRKA